ncbi:hypothetical protein V1522DRAFT_454484 [Lipomyces starkeyi]
MSMASDENTLSDYDKALSRLKNNPPEQRIDIHMPYSQYLKLEECWSKIKLARGISEDQSIQQFVQTVNLTRRIFDKAQEYISSHGADASFYYNICEGGSPTRKGIYGNYFRGKKQADGTIMSTREGDMEEVMIAVEVGYSEHYTALCRDKDMWIEEQHVKVCIVVKAANIVDGSISFDGDSYVQVLRKSMKSTAEERYLDYIWP